MHKVLIKRAFVLFLILLLAIGMVACSTKKDRYVGTWYNIEDPDDGGMIITDDKAVSYDGEAGTISETDKGFLIQMGWDSVVAVYTEYEGIEAISVDGDMVFVKEYEKAKELYEKNKAAEEAAYEAEKQAKLDALEKLREEIPGDYRLAYEAGVFEENCILHLYDDNTYRLDVEYDILSQNGEFITQEYWQEGKWDTPEYSVREGLKIEFEITSEGDPFPSHTMDYMRFLISERDAPIIGYYSIIDDESYGGIVITSLNNYANSYKPRWIKQ